MKWLRQIYYRFHRRKIKREKFSRENLDESWLFTKFIWLFHCETFVLYSVSSYFVCCIEIKLWYINIEFEYSSRCIAILATSCWILNTCNGLWSDADALNLFMPIYMTLTYSWLGVCNYIRDFRINRIGYKKFDRFSETVSISGLTYYGNTVK